MTVKPSDASQPIPLRPPEAPAVPIAAVMLPVGIAIAVARDGSAGFRAFGATVAIVSAWVIAAVLRALWRKVEATPDELRERRMFGGRTVPWDDVAVVRHRRVSGRHASWVDLRVELNDRSIVHLPLRPHEENRILALLRRRLPNVLWIDTTTGDVSGALPAHQAGGGRDRRACSSRRPPG